MMRRILVDHARARLAAKRSGQWARVTFGDADDVARSPTQIDLLDLDAALERLAAFDARKSRLAGLRFFGGLLLEEIGQALEVSEATIERDWRATRARLFRTLLGQRR